MVAQICVDMKHRQTKLSFFPGEMMKANEFPMTNISHISWGSVGRHPNIAVMMVD